MVESIAQEIERLLDYEVMELDYAEWLVHCQEQLYDLEYWQLRTIAMELGIVM